MPPPKIRTVEIARHCLLWWSGPLQICCGAVIIGVGWNLWANRSMAVMGETLYDSVAIAFIVMGCVLICWSALGWCTYGRVDGWCNFCFRHSVNKYMVAFHAPVAFCIAVVLIAVAVFFLVLSAQIASGDQYWVDKMDASYREAVQARPAAVCRMMTDYGCAGFRASCEKGVLGDGNKYCPDLCLKQAISRGGKNIPLFSKENPVCYPQVQADLVSTMNIAAGFTIASGGAMCLALFVVCFHFYFRDEDRSLVYDEREIADLTARLDIASKAPSPAAPSSAARPPAGPPPAVAMEGGKGGSKAKIESGDKTARFREPDDAV